ncbi:MULTISPECIES: alkaline phosphatase D family protein [Cyanophyceae]|uniref:alkaline phosphatase D family protein n=1 Tax=Cyanophyceae TaxID=3028117 RepID=UPI00232CC9C4|nr:MULTISPECIES: alkaline phosphatase [Cyanophyceae]MDB9358684.1 alkaline phosphatase [Nodularia spumigena CS-587/03]MDB9303471.1 alkaline phosphatase [Nodularia spumigena CS-591/12]MDB9318357.1 alkaline phosphatase [Nodularia spumigena CS-590/01A]MDB9323743.1 alkaline phosphatase [Nodularia spumigena CS-591/07A]MDB9326030.1 alkaline phosphatase [Nodularia spumigena CS-590/02]
MELKDYNRLLANQCKRRSFLLGAGFLTGLTVTSQWQPVLANPRFSGYPFSLGVASGDPLPDAVVIWTRLAPNPLNGGGMPLRNVPVRWKVALDEKMRRVVRRGSTLATPELGHSVHVDVRGLEPDRWYWYQFQVGREFSPIGRTRTAPAFYSSIQQLNFAFVSCQDWQNGFYTAFRHLAEENLDLVVHLGDYIYEYGPEAGAPRQHNGPEIVTLEDYRNRHALYKTDPHLQAAHAACPWLVTWDDHEVDNNYANLIPEDNQTLEAFTQRRVNAYQAYYEHMPLRRSSLPNGADMLLYRRFTFGNLAEFNVLDTRQYRTNQPCDDGLKPRCAEALDSNATMNGSEQEQWLLTGLDQSRSRWNIIAQQTMFAQYNFNTNPEPAVFNVDQWDGYVAERDRILNFLNQRQPSNPVVITGDIHSSWVHDLKLDFDNPNSPTVGTEFVGTSISSDFPAQFIAPVQASLINNPHTKFFDGAFRGYVRCKLTPGLWQSDYRAVSSIIDLNASVKTLASFVVEDGQPGALVN